MSRKKKTEDIKPEMIEKSNHAAGTDQNSLLGSHTETDEIIIQSEKGIVTRSDIDRLTEEYIYSLPMPEQIYKNHNIFAGLLNYIYSKCLYRYIRKDNNRYNYTVLDIIHDYIYMPISLRFGYTPNIYTFCMFTNVNSKFLMSIYYHGVSPSFGNSVNIEIVNLVKKWVDNTENSLATDVIQRSNIGSMFALKAKFNWTENNTITINHDTETTPKLSIDQLNAIGEQEENPTMPEDAI